MATCKHTKFTEFLEGTKLSLESDLKLKGALAAIFGGLASGSLKEIIDGEVGRQYCEAQRSR